MTAFGDERDELLGAHPTVKPVALAADAIKDVSRRGDVVFDPFLGSGTTLIAAHRTGRRCYGVEIDPAYVDVILRRWEAETGKAPALVSSGACVVTPLALPAPSMAPISFARGKD
jgi:DNA modification methylase